MEMNVNRGLRTSRASLQKLREFESKDKEREERQMLVAWLNQNKGKAQYKRVVGLIAEIQEAREATPSITVLDWALADASGRPTPAVSWKKIRRINSQLRGFKFWRRIIGRRKVGGHSKQRLALSRLIWEWWPQRDEAARVVRAITRLEEQGLWDSLSECSQCGKWLCKSRRRQRFCSPKCREKHFRSSDEGRRKRAAYMRSYRAQPNERMSKRNIEASRTKMR